MLYLLYIGNEGNLNCTYSLRMKEVWLLGCDALMLECQVNVPDPGPKEGYSKGCMAVLWHMQTDEITC